MSAGTGPRWFGPMTATHPLVGEKCPGCSSPFEEGDITTLVFVGPGDDPEAQRKAREGGSYTGVALPAHYACVTGLAYPPDFSWVT